MGNVFSSVSTAQHFTSDKSAVVSEIMNDVSETSINMEERSAETDSSDDREARIKAREEDMKEFNQQLKEKREKRKQILAKHRAEKEHLQNSLQLQHKKVLELKKKNRILETLLSENNISIPDDIQQKDDSDLTDTLEQMKNEFAILKSNNNRLRCDLAESNKALQNAYSDVADLSAQYTESMKQINALKDVVSISKTMVNLREHQLDELKNKLTEIEQSLADREANMLSVDLRKEYERQLQNIRTLRGLYEERARLAEVTRQNLVVELEEQRSLNEIEINKCKTLTERVAELEEKEINLENIIESKNEQVSSYKEETNILKAEMTTVNMLFAQFLLRHKTKPNLDRLIDRLEENHGILTQMAEKENGSEAASALPKLLLEIVSQVDEHEATQSLGQNSKEENDLMKDHPSISNDNISSQSKSLNSSKEIVENLPKVWKVLMELLSQQNTSEDNTEKVTTCYKSIDTLSGPVLVPSVSQTYIRLKDLIVEKLTLIKEVNRMKQLNSHLEIRLEEQEQRLCLVTSELSKTWHVVGRLRRHHHQLHTHEKILKYELQQKRKLLNELKEELEYCRQKWIQAREKNLQSEKDWTKLRAEFSSRKFKSDSPLNNSAESGYSDERPSDESSESNDESEYIPESLVRCKKKNKMSVETNFDSSADCNLAAERDDPASDLIDVAELPFDTQDGDHNHMPIRSNSNRDVSEEVNLDLSPGANNRNDSVDAKVVHNNDEDNKINCVELNLASSSVSENTSGIVEINFKSILESIQKQNARLAKKDEKLDKLERSSSNLLNKMKTTAAVSEKINQTIDHILNRPSSSLKNASQEPSIEKRSNFSSQTSATNVDFDTDSENMQKENGKLINRKEEHNDLKDNCNEILENGFRLDMQDELNVNVDNEYENKDLTSIDVNQTVVASLSHYSNDNNVKELLDTASSQMDQNHFHQGTCVTNNERDLEDSKNEAVAGQSSSSEDHEARFAARDIRLKRLEEQTKSLVSNVNKTNTKGVKIHYKLQELHNIYGSESSRASTPDENISSEESPNKKNKSDDE